MMYNDINERIQRIRKAMDVIEENSHDGSCGEQVYQTLYKAEDAMEVNESERYINDILNDCEKQLMESAKYAGYTNYQKELVKEVILILNESEVE